MNRNPEDTALMTKATILRWTTPSNQLPVPYEPVPVRLQPQQGDNAMHDQDITKRIAVKYVGSTRPTETVILTPGTTTRDLLIRLDLDPAGYQVLDARNDKDFKVDDVLFARVVDGDLVHISAHVQAGA